jgi:hypothetical protein
MNKRTIGLLALVGAGMPQARTPATPSTPYTPALANRMGFPGAERVPAPPVAHKQQ